MDIIEKMAQNGGEKSGSLSKNRSEFQLHYAMCLYFAEYLSDKDKDFQIFLDYDDDISLVQDNHVSFYQVKTSDIEKALTASNLSGSRSDYIINLYKHIHKLGLEGIQSLFLISNLKIEINRRLFQEISLESFPDEIKNKIVDLIKNKYGIKTVQRGFFALTKVRQTELPVNDYVSYVVGKLAEVLEKSGAEHISYNPQSIYTCIKKRFDKQNNFEDFDKITNKMNLLRHKGIEASFLKKLIANVCSHTYNDSEKNYKELLNKKQVSINEYRNFTTGLARVKDRILSRDQEVIVACHKIQDFIKNYRGSLTWKTLDEVYRQLNTLNGRDKYGAYALIFLAIEAYQNGESL